MRVRSATIDDASRIAALHAASWRRFYRGALSDAYLAGDIDGDRARLWQERLRNAPANQRVLAAEEAGAVVGFACAFVREDAQWGSLLDNIHVDHAAQGRGAGKRLMKAVAELCAASAPEHGLFLWVIQSNVSAQGFYRSLGGQMSGEDVWSPPGGGSVPRFRIAWPPKAAKALAGA